MEWFDSHLLSILTLLPLAWAGLGLGVSQQSAAGKAFLRGYSLVGSLCTLALSFLVYSKFDAGGPEFQLTEQFEWIPALGIQYSLGLDGLSLWLVLLTTCLTPLVVLASFNAVSERTRGYYFLLLCLETGMLGAFLALDVFLFYVFWEAMLVPMYFLIGIWGSKDRIYAAMKFFLYTMVGSLLMLVAILYLAYQHKLQFGNFSTAIVDLYRLHLDGAGIHSPQAILFLAFAFAFAIKVPLFPFHTWLPDAHVQAPTAGSVILAGVLLKMGGYGFLRFAFPLFPQAVVLFQPLFLIMGSVAIVYGAFVAYVQPDIKKLVAYSSVSHMGYVIVGLFSLNTLGVGGALYQMLNHGVSTGGLFLLIGMIYERRHTRELKEYGGIAKVMPWFTIAFMIMTLSSVALPGTNGFVGEFLILLGAWKASPVVAGVSALGVILGAVYMLWLVQKMFFGPITHSENSDLYDLSPREGLILLPLVIAVFVMGIFPGIFFSKMEPSVNRFVARFQSPASMAALVDSRIGIGE